MFVMPLAMWASVPAWPRTLWPRDPWSRSQTHPSHPGKSDPCQGWWLAPTWWCCWSTGCSTVWAIGWAGLCSRCVSPPVNRKSDEKWSEDSEIPQRVYRIFRVCVCVHSHCTLTALQELWSQCFLQPQQLSPPLQSRPSCSLPWVWWSGWEPSYLKCYSENTQQNYSDYTMCQNYEAQEKNEIKDREMLLHKLFLISMMRLLLPFKNSSDTSPIYFSLNLWYFKYSMVTGHLSAHPFIWETPASLLWPSHCPTSVCLCVCAYRGSELCWWWCPRPDTVWQTASSRPRWTPLTLL